MYKAEATSTPPNASVWNNVTTDGWSGAHFDSTTTVDRTPKTADYWASIAESVKATNPSEALLYTSPHSTQSALLRSPSPSPEKGALHISGVPPIIGPIYARSKLLRRLFNTVALLSMLANPISAPRQAEASGTLAPFNQSYPICVGPEKAKEMRHSLCAQGHGILPCTKKSLGNKFFTTSKVEGSRCEFTCVYRSGFLGINGYHVDLTNICISSNDQWVTDLTGIDFSADNTNTTQTVPPPTENYGTVQTYGQVVDGQVQGIPPGGDGICNIWSSFDDPDCSELNIRITIFDGASGSGSQPVEQAPPLNNVQVPYVPASDNTTEWQFQTRNPSGSTTSSTSGGQWQQPTGLANCLQWCTDTFGFLGSARGPCQNECYVEDNNED